MTHREVLGVRIDDLSDDELIGQLRDWMAGDRARIVVTPNPEFVLAARRDSVFAERLLRSDLSLPDGVGLRFAAAALTNERPPMRHTGVDTLYTLARLCVESGKRIALFGGGTPSSGETAAKALREVFPGLDVIAIHPGNISMQDHEDPPKGTDLLGSHHPTVVAVALGQGKQEWFMEKAADHLPTARIFIGVGGALETVGGTIPRAPKIMRQLGFEWTWRLVRQPSRIGRIFNAVIVFPAVIVWATLKRRRFLKGVRNVLREIGAQLNGL
jgi:N-acetylglucosaminyldiphosphoundecaprenol N-acetyl-beta-D-mannosaminyltransferase